MSITAKEIAQMLGISAAAVSMALSGKKGVSETTRSRVIEFAKEHGYDFSRSKQRHSRGKIVFLIYKKHGAIVGDTPFFSELTEGVVRACREKDFSVDIQYIFDTDLEEGESCKLIAPDTDGVILLGTELRELDAGALQKLPVPMVVLDFYYEGLERDSVLINNVQGAYLATNYLISKRRGQPGYLRSAYPIGNFEERADGFYKSIRENGLSASRSVVHSLAPSIEGAYSDMCDILKSGEKPVSCYFADNDLIAIGAMRAMKEYGYKIPEDVAVVGFDNVMLCELVEPQLTSINVPKQAMAKAAVERLVNIIAAPGSEKVKIELMTSLVKRASV